MKFLLQLFPLGLLFHKGFVYSETENHCSFNNVIGKAKGAECISMKFDISEEAKDTYDTLGKLDDYISNEDKCNRLADCNSELMKKERDCNAKLTAALLKGEESKYNKLYTEELENTKVLSSKLLRCFEETKILKEKVGSANGANRRSKRSRQSEEIQCLKMQYEDIRRGVEETYKKLIILERTVLDGDKCEEKLVECEKELLKKERECGAALKAAASPETQALLRSLNDATKELRDCQVSKTKGFAEKTQEVNKLTSEKSQLKRELSTEKQLMIKHFCGEPRTSKKSNALYDASRDGKLEEVRTMLKNCENPDGLGSNDAGWTALGAASWFGKPEIASLLLDFGANVNYRSQHNFTPLILASYNGQAEVVKVLLRRGADVNLLSVGLENAVWYASAAGHVEALKAVIAAGGDVNVVDNIGRTPLSSAAKDGNHDKKEEIKKLLQAAGATK